MPDLDLNGQGTQQDFTFQDSLPFRLIFSKGSPFPDDSCAFIRFEYFPNDVRLPLNEQRIILDCSTGGQQRIGRPTREIYNNIWNNARLPSFSPRYQNTPWITITTPGQLMPFGFELNTSTNNDGLFTINKNAGNVILDYPSEMTVPKYIAPFSRSFSLSAEQNLPLIPEGQCNVPVVRTVVDIRSFCFQTAKYELFVVTEADGIKRINRPLFGNITRTNLFIRGQLAPTTCP